MRFRGRRRAGDERARAAGWLRISAWLMPCRETIARSRTRGLRADIRSPQSAISSCDHRPLRPPGAGKGTQAEPACAAARRSEDRHRRRAARRGARGHRRWARGARRYMDRGDLVPDAVILGIMKDALARPEMRAARSSTASCAPCRRPRGSSAMLERARPPASMPCSLFDIDDDELVRRLSGRTVCEQCQTPYTGASRARRATSAAARSCGGRTTSPSRCATGSRVYQRADRAGASTGTASTARRS